MSLLNNPTASLTREQQIAKQLLAFPSSQFNYLLNAWGNQIRSLWAPPAKTQEILDEIGTDAAELFQLSANLGAFLEAQKPGCTAPYMTLMKPFTVNPDGTITVNP